ncbi:MAG: hypothetical protein E7J90_12710, partial [Cutibacterium avidum]|nr:hypothetical protein [Cutibacterium avidum]
EPLGIKEFSILETVKLDTIDIVAFRPTRDLQLISSRMGLNMGLDIAITPRSHSLTDSSTPGGFTVLLQESGLQILLRLFIEVDRHRGQPRRDVVEGVYQRACVPEHAAWPPTIRLEEELIHVRATSCSQKTVSQRRGIRHELIGRLGNHAWART